MVPAFGFGVGDFVAVATLVWKLSQALSETSEDSKLYRECQLELYAFQGVVVQFQHATANGVILSHDQVVRTRDVLSQIERLINEFNRHMGRFRDDTSSVNKDGTRKVVSLRQRVAWSFFGKRPIQQFREAIRGYTAVLTFIMQSIHSQNMQHLQQQMRDGTQSLNLQLQAGTEQLKLHIDNVVQDPWDQKPIRFQDATGRRYPVPLEVCGTFEGFTDFLQHAFKDSPILNAVQQQSIWLFTPVLGQPKNWILITAEDWQLSVCPGMQLGMSVFAGRRVTNGPVSDLLSEIPEDDAVKLQTPLPLWASSSFFEDARFRPRTRRQEKLSNPAQPRCSYGGYVKAGQISEAKAFNIQAQVASYLCPKKEDCGKSFKSYSELCEHLKPEILSPDSLDLFQGFEYGSNCLQCGCPSSYIFRSKEEIFAAGIKLQRRLTGSGIGLARCIADLVSMHDYKATFMCPCCLPDLHTSS